MSSLCDTNRINNEKKVTLKHVMRMRVRNNSGGSLDVTSQEDDGGIDEEENQRMRCLPSYGSGKGGSSMTLTC